MQIFALADLHLAVSVPQKSMEKFGWSRYMERIEENWRAVVAPEDLVLLPGDISWAMRLEEAIEDFAWIDALPGTKVMIRGNHDLWWGSISKVRAHLPPSLHAIQNDAYTAGGVSVAGSRLWDSPEYDFSAYSSVEGGELPPVDEKIYARELARLEMSLKQLDRQAHCRIAMTHYPPISATLAPSAASALFEHYGVDIVVFGHLHACKEWPSFGEKNGISYLLTAADFLDFTPKNLSFGF